MTLPAAAVRVAICMGALFGVGSCSSIPPYQGVVAGLPAAEMKFLKSYGETGFGRSAGQYYSLSTDETCKTAREAAFFGPLQANEYALRVVPDAPILVWASTSYYVGTSSKSCLSVARFTPQSDHAYDVSQPTTEPTETYSPSCRVTIIDRATGAPPPGVEFVKASPCIGLGVPR